MRTQPGILFLGKVYIQDEKMKKIRPNNFNMPQSPKKTLVQKNDF